MCIPDSDSGLQADHIVGSTNVSGKRMFLIKWKGSGEAALVEATEANVKWPQVVIKYYEAHSYWCSFSKDEKGETTSVIKDETSITSVIKDETSITSVIKD